jgi:hypothetical protein
MKKYKYRGHTVIRCSATNAASVPFTVMFRAFKNGKEVAKAYFKSDLEFKIDQICDSLQVGDGSVTGASQTETTPSSRSDAHVAGATNFGG